MTAHSTAAQRSYGVAPPAFRLPDDTRLGAVRLQVSDLERSLGFYQQVLGLRVLDRTADRAQLGPIGDDRPLVELRERRGAGSVPRRSQLGLYHFAILLPDRAALGRFIAHLGAIGAAAGSADHLVSEAVYLTDPDGLGIEVYADRPRSTWRTDGRQLVMATNPLDLSGLIGLVGGAHWAGMPAGTTIGHVHLVVGALPEAEVFYHAGLGFDKVVWSYPGALFLSAGGYHHHLGTNTWAPGARRAEAGDPRLLEWTLVLPRSADARAAASAMRSAGHDVVEEGDEWLTADPWGTVLRVVSED
jgi:catechol 2,3-dioxygenase